MQGIGQNKNCLNRGVKMRVIVTAMIVAAVGLSFSTAQSNGTASQSTAHPTAPKELGAAMPPTAAVETAPAHKAVTHKVSRKAEAVRLAELNYTTARAAGLKNSQTPFYMPLARPGMPSRYDILGWHGAKVSSPQHAALTPRQAKTVVVRAEARPAETRGAGRPAWYSPNNRPGMTNRYDLYGRHPGRKA